jgi:hypothetical protein
VLDFLELVALFVRNGTIDLELAWQSFSYSVDGYVRASKSVIAEERDTHASVWANLDWLAQQFATLERQKDGRSDPPPDPREFLHDEAELAPTAPSGTPGGS